VFYIGTLFVCCSFQCACGMIVQRNANENILKPAFRESTFKALIPCKFRSFSRSIQPKTTNCMRRFFSDPNWLHSTYVNGSHTKKLHRLCHAVCWDMNFWLTAFSRSSYSLHAVRLGLQAQGTVHVTDAEANAWNEYIGTAHMFHCSSSLPIFNVLI
jgi:hypothetical protein